MFGRAAEVGGAERGVHFLLDFIFICLLWSSTLRIGRSASYSGLEATPDIVVDDRLSFFNVANLLPTALDSFEVQLIFKQEFSDLFGSKERGIDDRRTIMSTFLYYYLLFV
jgi:hypothetical protein